VRAGILEEDAVADLLGQQREPLPLASMAYVLGYAGETSLVRALARQAGVPGVVFEGSKIDLSLLDTFDTDWLIRNRVLPVHREDRRLFLAVANPEAMAEMSRQVEFDHDVNVVIHTSLQVVLDRTIRNCIAERERGRNFLIGAGAKPTQVGPVVVVATMLGEDDENRVAGPVSSRAETKGAEIEELESMDAITRTGEETTNEITRTRHQGGSSNPSQDRAATQVDLDSSMEVSEESIGPKRVLVVDDDFASRQLIVKELRPEGYDLLTSSGGRETVNLLRETALDAVILDAMLPEIDGFQICRAIKQSRRYRHIPVVLMSALLDSGQVNEKVLRQYGADAYFVKPVDIVQLRVALRDLIQKSRAGSEPKRRDETFEGALESYRAGELDVAMEELRNGIEDDPLSPKYHFVLANLLQKKGELYEAIDEYENVVDLRPDYFPALTRLAYLYYKKGYSAKAVDTWRRSLPHCPDPVLRENIEDFMRKLIAGMQSDEVLES
jgi:DNA-binding response OmpR family regulator